MELTAHEIERYSRQLILSTWSAEKQLRLKHTSIAIDSKLKSAAFYLVAAGAQNICLYGKRDEALEKSLKELDANIKIEHREESHKDCDFIIKAKNTGQDGILALQEGVKASMKLINRL